MSQEVQFVEEVIHVAHDVSHILQVFVTSSPYELFGQLYYLKKKLKLIN
jgi:hypothetical protein